MVVKSTYLGYKKASGSWLITMSWAWSRMGRQWLGLFGSKKQHINRIDVPKAYVNLHKAHATVSWCRNMLIFRIMILAMSSRFSPNHFLAKLQCRPSSWQRADGIHARSHLASHLIKSMTCCARSTSLSYDVEITGLSFLLFRLSAQLILFHFGPASGHSCTHFFRSPRISATSLL